MSRCKCRKGARCSHCMERDRLIHDVTITTREVARAFEELDRSMQELKVAQESMNAIFHRDPGDENDART